MARKVRVSETFYFDFNGEKTDKIYRDPAGMRFLYYSSTSFIPNVMNRKHNSEALHSKYFSA
jgi:hypothetical protein